MPGDAVPRARLVAALLLAVAGPAGAASPLALAAGPAAPSPCVAREGRLHCADGQSFPIVDDERDPWSARAPRGLSGPPWRAAPRHDPRRDPLTDVPGAVLVTPDGRVCWPHGDHVHCRREP
jgi:hypothetical protein